MNTNLKVSNISKIYPGCVANDNITLEKIFKTSKLTNKNQDAIKEIYNIESCYINLFLDKFFSNSINLNLEKFEKLKKFNDSKYYNKLYRYKSILYINSSRN